MKKVVSYSVALCLILFSVVSCSDKEDTPPPPIDPKYSEYIAAFTSGVISRTEPIRIQLTRAIEDSTQRNSVLNSDLADFDPEIDGVWTFENNYTLLFTPSQMLPTSTIYDVNFHLGKVMDVPADMSEFVYRIETMQQHLSLAQGQLKPYQNTDLEWYYLTGNIHTRDAANHEDVQNTLTASQEGRNLNVSWTGSSDMKTHGFRVDSISRKEVTSRVVLSYDGQPVDSEEAGEVERVIPALGDFSLMEANTGAAGSNEVTLQFSDPLDPEQDLSGLVTLSGVANPQIVVEDNIVKLMFDDVASGEKTVFVSQGIENIMGYKLGKDVTAEVVFFSHNPEVKLVDQNRTILPSTDGLSLPFEAVSLSAINVTVVQIYEKNVPQFLQSNELDGNYHMTRVGRVIRKKRIALDPEKELNLSKWNRFNLDLEDLIKTEPGAIYRIEIDFDKSQAICDCPEDENNQLAEEPTSDWENQNGEYTYWDYNDYSNYHYYGYDYSKRNDPCHEAYYRSRRGKDQNILASDIGMIAKLGNDKSMMIALSDLKSTEPLSGVKVDLIDFQQQLISKYTTNSEGLIEIDLLDRKPFLAIASHKGQKGYLKLNSNALSVSTFDVSGESVNDGLKGFLYGERGVWRPGDTLFLNFMLQDEKNTLPKNHPVTFELINPRGQLTERIVRRESVGNIYNFTTKTGQDDPTGNWTARVKVGGNTFSRFLRIETVKPNRLKIDLKVPGDKISAGTKEVKADLKVEWLTGATARNLKAKVDMTLKPANTYFEDFKNYNFDDPVRDYEPEQTTVFEGKTDQNGKATFAIEVPAGSRAPGMLNANFSTKAFENGGDFSVNRMNIPYAPFISFAGIKMPEGGRYGRLETNKKQTVQIATVDSDGKPVKRSLLNIKIYKVEWRWWWQGRENNLSRFVSDESVTPVIEGQTSTGTDGKGTFDFEIENDGWGRYLIRVEDPVSGHKTGEIFYTDWSGWRYSSRGNNSEGATMLIFSTNKDDYTVGENCTVTFPSSGVGRALVTIESGDRVIDANWVKAEENETSYTFEVTEEMAPNVYVNVTLVQPHRQTANDLPIRLYGVMPIMVEYPETHLYPKIKAPKSVRPEETFTVEVSEKTGRKMNYTVAIVDQGLLDLTNFETPDPWSHFYAREALGVTTWDLYDQVIGAYGAQMDKLLSLGGGGGPLEKGSKQANRFKPVVLFSEPQQLAAGETDKIEFTMPNYVGAVRVMVIASEGKAYGHADQSLKVKQPLMVLSTLPRVAGPGETVIMPVTVFAMEDNIKTANVDIAPNEFFEIVGPSSKQVQFETTGDKTVNFELKVRERLGVGKVKTTVNGSGESASFNVEMNVRNPNPMVTETAGTVLTKAQNWSTNFDLLGMTGTNSVTLEVSSFPAMDLERRINYLIRYPHGCIEQTTSGAFPQLYLKHITELSESDNSRIERNVSSAIRRISRFQLSSGGFSYWPGSDYVSDWGTTYAGHFLLEAEKAGFTLSSSLKSRWISYQSNQARSWPSGSRYERNDELAQAYRLFTLALAGAPEMGAMNRLRERSSLSVAASWRLAAAYQLAGQSQVASRLVDNLTKNVEPYNELSETFGSNWRDQAMIAETLILMDRMDDASEIVKELAENLSDDRWYSTQTTAYSLLAISRFAKDGIKGQVKYSYSINSGGETNKVSQMPLSQTEISVSDLSKNGNQLSVTNSSENLLFVRLISEGQPIAGQEKAKEENLFMEVKYFTLDGDEIDVSNLTQGTDFMAKVTVRHPNQRRYYREMALTQIFPSGWEIINTRMDEAAGDVYESDHYDYQDVRDDRVYTYFNLRRGRSKTFTILLNATYLGRYYLPAVDCAAMYDNTIYSRTSGKWVTISKPGK
ncbi:alpha-2-macroglobulin family protein [Halocola ammonii]